MFKSESKLQTVHGSNYISKLCKHFAHKIEVTFNEERGECQLPSGPAVMLATPEEISFHVSAESEEKLNLAKAIIEDHFIRFARKEGFEKLDWQDTPQI